jgi:hypothetical protein
VTRALILKELREHGWVLAALLLVQAITLLVLILDGKGDGSAFVALKAFSVSIGVIGVLVLNNRLVVREFTARTQLFLETLPVTRRRVLMVKLLLGFALAMIPIALATAVCVLVAQGREPIGLRYVGILSSRLTAFLFFVHALAFLAAMLGRYRFVFWGLLLGLSGLVIQSQALSASAVPLLRLIDEKLAYERHHIPWLDLLTVVTVAVGLLGFAFALGLSQEGGLAANLARRMTHREKVFFGGLTVVLFFVHHTVTERRPRPLFELAQAARVNEGDTFVGIASGTDADPAAEAAAGEMGAAVAADLESLRLWLAMSTMPPLFVVPDSSLDADDFVRAKLEDADGVVLKAPLESPALDPLSFRAFAVEQVLFWYSRGRSRREPMRWFSAGLAHHWVLRGKPDDRLALRAAATERGVISVASLRDWLVTRERLGPCLADAVETQLVGILAALEGEAAFKALAQTALGTRPPQDFRATLTRRSIEQLLAEQGTVRLDALVAAFNKKLDEDRIRFAPELAKLQRLEAVVKPVSVGNGTQVEVFHEVHAIPASVEPVEYTVRYSALAPWTGPITQSSIPRFDTRGSGVLPYVFVRGARIFTAFEALEPVLGCNVRFASRREVLQ